MTQIRVVWNASAGSQEVDELRSLLEEMDDVDVVDTDTPDEARDAAAAAGADVLVIAAGGDGTVNSVAAGALAAPERPMFGVLPIGTANDFARSLGLPADPLENLELWRSPRIVTIDAVHVRTPDGERTMLNVASGGNSARIHDALDPELKERWGAFSYIRGAISVMTDLTTFDARITCDERPAIELPVVNLIVANARFAGGGVDVAPPADLEDGLIDVIAIEDCPALDLASAAASAILGNYLEHESVLHVRAKRVTIESRPPIAFSIDGEHVSEGVYSFEVLPGALRAVVGPVYPVE